MRTLFGRGQETNAAPDLTALRGPAFTAAAVLAIALFVSVLGSAVTYVRVDAAYKQQNAVNDAQRQLDTLFSAQLDEETGLRGYLASGQKSFLNPYYSGRPTFDDALDQLYADLQQAQLSQGYPVVFDLRHTNNLWQSEVAKPLLSHPTGPGEQVRLVRGKAMVDRMREDFHTMSTLLDQQSLVAQDAVRTLLLRAALLTAGLILLFGVTAIVADVVRSRTEASLERERIVGDTLQRAS